MRAINIEWEDYKEDLPTEVELPNGMTDEYDIENYISDKYGYCFYAYELVD